MRWIERKKRARQKEPTMQQIQELIALMQKVSPDQMGDLMAEAKEKQKAENWNNRQRVEWSIQGLKKLADVTAKNATSAPATRPANGNFGSVISGLQFFSPTSGVAVTSMGILTTDGTLDRWKGSCFGWDKPHNSVYLIGGTEKEAFLITTDTHEVVVKEGFDPPAGNSGAGLQRVVKHGKKSC